MHDAWTDRLSEYLDETMDRAERTALEAHLASCRECTGVLADLDRVRAQAREWKEAPLPRDLWSRIERSIAHGGPTRVSRLEPRGRGRFSFSLPELLAACLAVAVISGGVVFAVLHKPVLSTANRPVPVASAPETRAEPAPPVTSESASPSTLAERSPEPPTVDAVPAVRSESAPRTAGPGAETPNEEAISELRKALASRRDKLDPATIRTLETNLAIIDLAIDQAKRALVADSANTYVKEHLAETMRRKVELLQRATMLASTSGSEETR